MNNHEKQYIRSLLSKKVRQDGRGLTDYRDVSVEYGVTRSAEGSARVKIGDTEVIAGVKLELGTPYPDTPDEGGLMVGVELLPMASPEFEMGPPGIQAIELSRVVDRAIRESKAIDVKKLCITPGEKIWTVIVDICTINDSGNLFDVCALAAIAALKDARIPKVEDDKVVYGELTDEKLPLNNTPVSMTVLKIGDDLVVDPLPEEEDVADARLTVAVMEDGTLCALQKGNDDPLSIEDIDSMVAIVQDKSKELLKNLG